MIAFTAVLAAALLLALATVAASLLARASPPAVGAEVYRPRITPDDDHEPDDDDDDELDPWTQSLDDPEAWRW